jgi:hypothetical protein
MCVCVCVACDGGRRFEARGCGHEHQKEVPAQVLNSAMQITKAGGQVGIPGTLSLSSLSSLSLSLSL